MSENKTYTITAVSEAISPLTHASGTAGNESIVMREPVITPRGIAYVPCLSGNAIRHRMIRSPGARHLVDTYGLGGMLDLKQLNFLFHGGALTDSGGRENLRLVADLKSAFPLLALLGVSLPGQIVGGSLIAGRGCLVCEENRPHLYAVLPAGLALPPTRLRPSESFVSGYQYTRGDARNTVPNLVRHRETLVDADEKADSHLMIFSGQAVTRGAMFLHRFVVRHGNPLEVGALLSSIELWQRCGGTIGGQASRGHGALSMALYVHDGDGAVDGDGCDGLVEEYRRYAHGHEAEAVSLLGAIFEKKAAKKKAKADATA